MSDYRELTRSYLDWFSTTAGKAAADALQKAHKDPWSLFVALSERLSAASRKSPLGDRVAAACGAIAAHAKSLFDRRSKATEARIEAAIIDRHDRIRELCDLAGRADLAPKFVARGLSEAAVRGRLQKLSRAAAEAERTAADHAAAVAAAVEQATHDLPEPEPDGDRIDARLRMPCHGGGAASLDSLTRDFWRARAAAKREEP